MKTTTGTRRKRGRCAVDNRLGPRRAGKIDKAPAKSAMRRRSDNTRLSPDAEALLSEPIEFIDNREFRRRNAEERILASVASINIDQPSDSPSDLPGSDGASPYIAQLYRARLLRVGEERDLFRALNYCRYRATRVQKMLRRSTTDSPGLRELKAWLNRGNEYRNLLMRANLRLVVSIAKRFARNAAPPCTFEDLISDGNEALLRAIAKFDYSKDFRLSTYATYAIVRHLSRSVQTGRKRREITLALDEVPGGLAEIFEAADDGLAREVQWAETEGNIKRLIQRLDDRDQLVIRARFGLDQNTHPETLQSIADRLGVCKERARQIVSRAIQRMRLFAAQEEIFRPEMLDAEWSA